MDSRSPELKRHHRGYYKPEFDILKITGPLHDSPEYRARWFVRKTPRGVGHLVRSLVVDNSYDVRYKIINQMQQEWI